MGKNFKDVAIIEDYWFSTAEEAETKRKVLMNSYDIAPDDLDIYSDPEWTSREKPWCLRIEMFGSDHNKQKIARIRNDERW